MKGIIGTRNAGFTIIDAIKTGAKDGYALGRSKNQFVTWWYTIRENNIEFYYGHYIPIDKTNITRSRTAAYKDFYERATGTLQCKRLALEAELEREQDNTEFYYDHPEGVSL